MSAKNKPALLLVADTFPPKVDGTVRFIEEFVSRAKDAWQTHINQAGLVHFSVPGGKSQDILVKTTIGFNVLFDLERDPV